MPQRGQVGDHPRPEAPSDARSRGTQRLEQSRRQYSILRSSGPRGDMVHAVWLAHSCRITGSPSTHLFTGAPFALHHDGARTRRGERRSGGRHDKQRVARRGTGSPRLRRQAAATASPCLFSQSMVTTSRCGGRARQQPLPCEKSRTSPWPWCSCVASGCQDQSMPITIIATRHCEHAEIPLQAS
jgi:hypothetical protein